MKTYPHYGQRSPPMLSWKLAGPLYIEPQMSVYQLELDELDDTGMYGNRPHKMPGYKRKGELERIIFLRRYKICA